MNVVYLLTNKSKESFPKYYIGSKVECDIIKVNGVDSIVSRTGGRIYYGSSSCPIMKGDLKSGHIFEAEVLEVVPSRSKVRSAEDCWLKEFNVGESVYFYNISDSAFIRHLPSANLVGNRFGETHGKIAKSYGSMGKKNLTARRLGFEGAYELALFIFEMNINGSNWAEISRILNKERHFSRTYVKGTNPDTFLKEDPTEYSSKVWGLYQERATIEYISEYLSLDKFTVMKSLSFKDKYNSQIAGRFGLDEDSFGKFLAKQVLKGKSFRSISKELNVDARVLNKTFIRYFRNRFKSSDFE